MTYVLNKLKQNKIELIVLLFVLIIAGVAHGYNMFHFPYYDLDEGTTISQAWSVLRMGKLDPYTFWYDHVPLVRILIASWALLTGGFFTFGLSINSGRVFMLIIHLISAVLVYLITKKLTKSVLASTLSSIIYSLSPLGIIFQRRVELDNVMSMWILLSLYFLLGTGKKLRHFIFSAVIFGLAFLSKEQAILYFPVFIYIAYSQTHKVHKSFAIVKWITISVMVISFYILYALLKGELFPAHSIFGGSQPHVSLIDALAFQLSRSGENFQSTLKTWISIDPFIIKFGVVSIIICIVYAIKQKASRFVVLLIITYLIYLVKGNVATGYYIIPLISLLSIAIALSTYNISTLFAKLPFSKISNPILYLSIILVIICFYRNKTDVYLKDQTSPQIKAIDWIKKNIPQDSVIVIDSFAYVDLSEKIPGTISIYKNAQYYWSVEKDPDIRVKLLRNDWRNIDYLLLSPQMKIDIYESGLNFVRDAYEASVLLRQYSKDGYTVDIRKVNDVNVILSKAWETYGKTFSSTIGAISDPYTSQTTSEGQAYSLLRSVWVNDKQEFDKVWRWTDENIKLKDKNLFAWLYGQKEEKGEVGIKDKGTATDADQDIALALLFGYKKWGNLDYLNQAKKIINDIWEYETVEIKGKRYIMAGDWASAKENKIYTVNPSYVAPYAYRIFAEVDTQHDWNSLMDSSYEILRECSESSFDLNSSANIPPDWCATDRNGKILIASTINDKSTNYSYDAIRTLWRVALDYQWNNEPRALSYLQKMDIWSREWKEKQKIFTNYSHDGKSADNSESLAHYGIQVAFFSVVNHDIANQIYKQKILTQWNNEGYWGDKNNYYDQNWVWFGTALYSNNLPNLWTK